MAAASSSASPQEKYDVFLSFRGEDTRHDFTSHLYGALCQKQIVTFIDDEELKTGDQISPSLLNAIEQSKISLIIFSKGYASSRWCLEELVKILECKNSYGQIVMPIFYKIDPSDVRNRHGTFEDAFAKHEERFKGRQEMLERWRTALTEAANLSGFHSNVIRSEFELVQEVVKAILMKLNNDSPLIDEDLVGIDSRIKDIERLLCIRFAGVRKIGIWGTGGIGKTTLAKVVFSKISRHFESSYFFENIREESKKSKGLTSLQQQIICKILGDEDANIGSPFIKKRLGRMKVLIVLDDVTNLKQIESLIRYFNDLGLGSRIIITTRDKQVLENCHVDDIYQTKTLPNDAACQLFSRHAFRQECPPKDFRNLAERVLSYVDGVPLALKVLGSFLFKRTKKQWESELVNLNINDHMDIQNVLKVSYDGLSENQKVVFLDIACFFNWYERGLIEAILNAHNFNSCIYIDVLIERCLITTSSNTIKMHDLLQEMGREIDRQESIDDPGRCSRLWDDEDILKVLTQNKIEVIRSMRLDMSKVSKLHLKPEAFNNMQNLKFLKVYGCKHDKKVPALEVLGSNSCLPCLNILKHCFERLLWKFLEKNSSEHEIKLHGFENLKSDFSELRYFCWDGYSANSLPPNFNPKNLVALYMHYSKVKQLWKGDQKLDNLKYIDLSYSKHLLRMPDLSLIPNLERLILSNCSNLEKVSFGPCTVKVLLLDGTAIKELSSLEHLVGLIKLSLKNCSRLESLPENICELKCLRYLYLSDCSKLDRLPNGLGNLEALEELEAEGLAIKYIPSSIKCLNNLKTLSFARCRIHELPSSLMIHLPVFCNLITLNLSDCCIEELPNNLGKLSSLSFLYLGGNKFETLPVSIKDLHGLFVLDVRNCQKLKSLPELPDSLSKIEAHSCTSLEALSGLSTPGHFGLASSYVNFTDCFNLKFHALPYLTNALANFQRKIIAQTQTQNFMPWTIICYSGSEIPEWFSFKSIGNFIKLPAGWLNDNLIGFVVCAVVSFRDHQEHETSVVGHALVVNGKYISCGWVFAHGGLKVIESDQVCILCDFKTMCRELLILSLNSEAYIQFFVENLRTDGIQFGQVKKCGVKLLYVEDNELRRDGIVEREQRLNSINCSVDDCVTCCLGYCWRHEKFDDYKRYSETLDRWSPHSRVYKTAAVYSRNISEEVQRRHLGQSDG